MTCAGFEARSGAYLDGELPEAAAAEMAAHLRECPACQAVQERQLALRAALQEHAPRFETPRGFEASLRRAIRGGGRRQLPERWLAVAAALVAVVIGSWSVATTRARSEALTNAVLASHIRSLVGAHLTDVTSSDQHTVKPWFNGKLDYSPTVTDLAARGYPLLGGRLDYEGDRTVAALVYGRRQHVIDVFLWPNGRGPSGGPAALTRQGYHMLHWSAPDYVYWVVSDLNPTELEEFVRLLKQE